MLYELSGTQCVIADVLTETSNYRFDGIDNSRMCNYTDDVCVQ